MWELTILYPYGRAHNQRWGIRDGFIYPVADPRLVLDTKVRCLCHGDGGEIKLAHEQHVGGQWLVSYRYLPQNRGLRSPAMVLGTIRRRLLNIPKYMYYKSRLCSLFTQLTHTDSPFSYYLFLRISSWFVIPGERLIYKARIPPISVTQ